VRALESDRVIVTGAVADMRAWLAAADIVVAPLKLARGIQNKVLEAMAMAKPVVASAAAYEGIEAVAGRDITVADDAMATVEAINGLLAAPERAAAMGIAARLQMERCYRWEARLAPLAAMVDPDLHRQAA
jgi:glycosyltransferase involved in cell wall biosynthesis